MTICKLILNVSRQVVIFGLGLCVFSSGVIAQTVGGGVAPYSPYAVDGLAVGGSVAPQSSVYKSYSCEPSDDYPGYTWCKRLQTRRSGSKNISVSTSIVHGPDNVVGYINQTVKPANFRKGDIQNELARLSQRFHSPPKVRNLTERAGSVGATLAIWGGIQLKPLASDDLSVLAEGKSPHRGILVDLLGDLHKSARVSLPVYSVSGEQGFVWVASYDRQGEGTLRFFAMDPSLLQSNTVAGPPTRQPRQRPDHNGKPNSRAGVSTGTGFFISQNGLVVTNAHVVEGCDIVQVSGTLSTPIIATVTTRDIADDLALIKTDSKPSVFASLRAGVRLGESVSAFGYPLTGILATGGNFTTGNVSALAGLRNDANYLQITAPIQPGNSGGPVLDQEGNVVGIVVAKLNVIELAQATNDVAQNVNFAIKTSVLLNFLEANGVQYTTASTTLQHLQPADLADRAKSISVLVSCATNQ